MLNQFAESTIPVHLAAQEVFSVGGFKVTNSLITGALSLIILLSVFGYVAYKVKKGQYNRFVGLVQWTFEGMLSQIDSVIPDKKVEINIVKTGEGRIIKCEIPHEFEYLAKGLNS